MAQTPDEKTYVEIPFIEQLKAMGWDHVEGDIDVPYLTNFNKLHITASGSTWRKIRCLQSKTGRYSQTCIAL